MNKIIHQSWNTAELTSEQIQWVDTVKKTHPDYAYVLWTHDENRAFVHRKYPEFLSFYDRLSMIERCDFVRPLYIFEYGGIYLDLDIVINKPLDDVLVGADVFLCEREPGIINGISMPFVLDTFFYAGEEGHPFFYDFCKSISSGFMHRIFSKDSSSEIMSILDRTGLYMLTKFYLLNKHKYKIKTFRDVIRDKSFIGKNCYGIHLQVSDWLRKNS